jgi:hypothetical protein
MSESFNEAVRKVKDAIGKIELSREEMVILTADEISRTTTFNEQHSRNAASASKQQQY